MDKPLLWMSVGFVLWTGVAFLIRFLVPEGFGDDHGHMPEWPLYLCFAYTAFVLHKLYRKVETLANNANDDDG